MQRLTKSFDLVSGQWSPCRLYTEQKWKRCTWTVCHLYAKWCNPVKQIKVYLNVQRLGYAYSKMFTDVVTKKHMKVKKRAKIRNRYNQAPHLNQDTNRKVTNSQLDTTNESQEVSPFPAGDHKTDAQESIAKTRQKMSFNMTGVH